MQDYARFSDRSIVSRVIEEFPARCEYMWEIFDVPMERMILVDPATKSLSTRGYSKAELLSYLTNMDEESCPENVSDLPRGGVYFGYQTVRLTTQDSAGFVQNRWMIPELECFSAKEIQERGGAHNETYTISLSEGEPSRDRALVPPEYTERSPGAIEKLHRLAGSRVFSDRQVTKLETDYQQRSAK